MEYFFKEKDLNKILKNEDICQFMAIDLVENRSMSPLEYLILKNDEVLLKAIKIKGSYYQLKVAFEDMSWSYAIFKMHWDAMETV